MSIKLPTVNLEGDRLPLSCPRPSAAACPAGAAGCVGAASAVEAVTAPVAARALSAAPIVIGLIRRVITFQDIATSVGLMMRSRGSGDSTWQTESRARWLHSRSASRLSHGVALMQASPRGPGVQDQRHKRRLSYLRLRVGRDVTCLAAVRRKR